MDSGVCSSGRPVRTHGPLESHVCGRELHLPPSLRSSNGARFPLANPAKRKDPVDSLDLETRHGRRGGLRQTISLKVLLTYRWIS